MRYHSNSVHTHHIDSVRFTHRKSRTNGTESRYFRLSFFPPISFHFIFLLHCFCFPLHICLMTMVSSLSLSLLFLLFLRSMNKRANEFIVRFICVFVCSLISSGHESFKICVSTMHTACVRVSISFIHSFLSWVFPFLFSFPSLLFSTYVSLVRSLHLFLISN